jgi:hypothetical protein
MQPQPITPKEQRAPMRGDMLLLINPQTSPVERGSVLPILSAPRCRVRKT